jgi:CoA:oxalate CoA-transferase
VKKTASRILDGIYVLDFTRVLAGPHCTRCLYSLGAEVIKIEKPVTGDDSRYQPYVIANGVSGYYVQQNYGKKSVSINLKKQEGIEIVKKIIKHSDVVVENFRTGVMDSLGLDYDSLKKINPRLIMCSISGFGQSGPYSKMRGYGLLADALSGCMSVTGYSQLPPPVFRPPFADITTGTYAALSIISALYSREKTGIGEYIDMALLDTMFAFHELLVQGYFINKGDFQISRGGTQFPESTIYGSFSGTDGEIVIAAVTDLQWKKMTNVMGMVELGSDPRFDTNESRCKNQVELVEIVTKWLKSFATVQEPIRLLNDAGIPSAKVNTVQEAIENAQLQHRNMVIDVDYHPNCTLSIPNLPLHFSNSPIRDGGYAPYIGEHNREVFSDILGYSQKEIEYLEKAGVIFSDPNMGVKGEE